jgi:hypothetical protein
MNMSELYAELQGFYPQMYVLKYLEMFENQGFEQNESSFENAAISFLYQHGKEAMQALILEIECIEANEDWASFSNLILLLREKNWAEETLQEMGKTVTGAYYAGMG